MLSHDGHRSSHKQVYFGKGAAERVVATAQRDSSLTLRYTSPVYYRAWRPRVIFHVIFFFSDRCVVLTFAFREKVLMGNFADFCMLRNFRTLQHRNGLLSARQVFWHPAATF